MAKFKVDDHVIFRSTDSGYISPVPAVINNVMYDSNTESFMYEIEGRNNSTHHAYEDELTLR